MQQTILVKPEVKGFYESRTGSIRSGALEANLQLASLSG